MLTHLVHNSYMMCCIYKEALGDIICRLPRLQSFHPIYSFDLSFQSSQLD